MYRSGHDDFIGGGDGEYETVGIAPEVERCRAVFEKYARQEGVFDQVNIIMALTVHESGGRSLDIMKSSESIGLPPKSITDPEYSLVNLNKGSSILLLNSISSP